MSKINLDELCHNLHRLNRQMHRVYHRESYQRDRFYQGQANLLLLIFQNDGASQRDLAEQMDIRPSSMTEMLSKLEQNGLIVKKRDDKDQRIMHIHLTENGKKQAEKVSENKDTLAESFFAGLTEDEQEQLFMLIKKLSTSLEEIENSHEEHICHKHEFGHRGGHHHDLLEKGGFHHRHGSHQYYHRCYFEHDR